MAIIIVITVAVLLGIFEIVNSMGIRKNSKDLVSDTHNTIIELIKDTDDEVERKGQIDHALERSYITQEEANELY